MGSRRLEIVSAQNAEMLALGSVCNQDKFRDTYKARIPVYTTQIRNLMNVLKSGEVRKKKEVIPLSQGQRLRHERILWHMLELRDETIIFVDAVDKNGRR